MGTNSQTTHGLLHRTKIVDWIKTTRIQTAMVTALALWVGYITVSPLTLESSLVLGLIGLAVHVWGFTLNEVEDYQYDKYHGNVDGHPIAQGRINPKTARVLSWLSALFAVLISVAVGYPLAGTVALLVSFVPGYLYNVCSKTHWWSNIYLAAWAFLITSAGALYAGGYTSYSWLFSLAISIQIFVQVIEGDLKDLEGPERTFAEALGVELSHMKKSHGTIFVSSDSTKYIYYPYIFTSVVMGLKAIEGVIILWAYYDTVISASGVPPLDAGFQTLLIFTAFIIFISTAYNFMDYAFDRDRIKKLSSIHELTSIAFIGMGLLGMHANGALLVVTVPILWYGMVNRTIHSGTLNPDI